MHKVPVAVGASVALLILAMAWTCTVRTQGASAQELTGAPVWDEAEPPGPGLTEEAEPLVPEVIRARRFELVNAQGEVQAVLGSLGDATGLVLAATGKPEGPSAILHLTADGEARLQLAAADGKASALIKVSEEGGAIALRGRNAAAGAALTVMPDGSPRLALLDKENRPRAELSFMPDGTTRLTMSDSNGEGRAALRVGGDGSPVLSLLDKAGKPRATLMVGEEWGPMLALQGADGQLVWSAP